MPRAAVRVDLRIGRLRQGEVHRLALLRRGRSVDRRAHERVTEHHPLADRPAALSRLGRRREPDAEPLGRAPHQQRVVDRLGRRHQQQQPRVLRERLEPPQEALLDPPRQRVRASSSPNPPGSCVARQRPRQLQDRQRVAARLGDEPVADALVEPARDDGREQGARVLLGRALRAPARGRPPSSRSSVGSRTANTIATDSASSRRATKPRTWRRGGIEPLGVIDEAQQRPLRGDLGQQAERGQGDQEAVGSSAGRQAQRDAQSGLLGLGKRAEPVEHRRAELMQPRERQLHLGLDAGDPRDAKAGRLPGAVVQERRLADARLAADDQHRALAAADVLQQPVERLTLAGAPQQERGTAGHGP